MYKGPGSFVRTSSDVTKHCILTILIKMVDHGSDSKHAKHTKTACILWSQVGYEVSTVNIMGKIHCIVMDSTHKNVAVSSLWYQELQWLQRQFIMKGKDDTRPSAIEKHLLIDPLWGESTGSKDSHHNVPVVQRIDVFCVSLIIVQNTNTSPMCFYNQHWPLKYSKSHRICRVLFGFD